MKTGGSPPAGLDKNWSSLKSEAFEAAQKPWGGVTIDTHTGQVINPSSGYALSIKGAGKAVVSVPEGASQTIFSAAMDQARKEYADELAYKGACLGVFHDDDHSSIEIDPATIVGSPHEVETLGSYTHAIGGAYDFSTGNGYWPPHVASASSKAEDQPYHWEGPGQWIGMSRRWQQEHERSKALKSYATAWETEPRGATGEWETDGGSGGASTTSGDQKAALHLGTVKMPNDKRPKLLTHTEAQAVLKAATPQLGADQVHRLAGWDGRRKLKVDDLERQADIQAVLKDSEWGERGAEALREWYNAGCGGAVTWGERGDFDACVSIAGNYIDNPEGYCNLRHQDATGAPPGHAPGEEKD